MHNQPGGKLLAQHVVEGPQNSLQTPIATSQVMQMGQSPLD
jgi:hypothetical protein